jgi:hypothetical protein
MPVKGQAATGRLRGLTIAAKYENDPNIRPAPRIVRKRQKSTLRSGPPVDFRLSRSGESTSECPSSVQRRCWIGLNARVRCKNRHKEIEHEAICDAVYRAEQRHAHAGSRPHIRSSHSLRLPPVDTCQSRHWRARPLCCPTLSRGTAPDLLRNPLSVPRNPLDNHSREGCAHSKKHNEPERSSQKCEGIFLGDMKR